MKNYNKINKNKQQQKNRQKRLCDDIAVYKRPGNYKVISKIDLSPEALEFELTLPYNFTMYDTRGMSSHIFSYLTRASDILLVTVKDTDVNQELVSLIKRHMPTTIVVYERRQKALARNVAKLFGDVPICEVMMLNSYLAKQDSACTALCKTRPYMVAQEVSYDGVYLHLGGYMRNGLRSDKIVINGVQEGIIEQVAYGEEVINGSDLNAPEDESQLVRGSQPEEDGGAADEGCYEDGSGDEGSGEDNDSSVSEFELEEAEEYELRPEYDLISKYSDYRGIMNLATCTFKDQEKPEYYKDLVFMKNIKYVQNNLVKNTSAVPSHTYVHLKVRTNGGAPTGPVVVFNLFEYETRNTIHNYDFSDSKPLPKEIVVDNGYRIYRASTILTRNLRHNVFKEERDLTHGVVSFMGPFSFFASAASVINDDGSVIKLLNGESKDRIFFDCQVLRGRPIKIYKRYCIIKGMFYSREQVEYFRNIRVDAKNDNKGFIKKPMGMHGLFKAYFNHPIKHDDAITMPLYKRMFL
ncbi:pre-rRNA-processing protein TSR1 [Pancytospora philotis]|nr:pre-rRNA-processing protein TSR1 [Pancytospora philotis]